MSISSYEQFDRTHRSVSFLGLVSQPASGPSLGAMRELTTCRQHFYRRHLDLGPPIPLGATVKLCPEPAFSPERTCPEFVEGVEGVVEWIVWPC